MQEKDELLGRLVYMDNAATSRPAPEVVEAMTMVLCEEYGNPSSLHKMGARAQKLVEEARKSLASEIGAASEEIYFTSGGTEANNWAILGTVRAGARRGKHIVSTAVEHPSVLATLDDLSRHGFDITLVGVDKHGLVNPASVLEAVRKDTVLVSVMLVQNEIGTIEPCQEIGRILLSLGPRRPRFHVDGVQAFAKLPIDVRTWGVDLLSASAHKIHGPKGIGMLYVRKGLKLPPLVFGGGQEKGMRSGTENVPGIAGFGTACRLWSKDREKVMERLAGLRKRLVEGIMDVAPDAVLHGQSPDEHGQASAAPHIVHFAFPGYRGESLLHALEEQGVFVSTGSACSSHKSKPSPVVLAMGHSEEEALSSIRFSMSRYTDQEDIELTVEAVESSLESLRAWRRKPARRGKH